MNYSYEPVRDGMLFPVFQRHRSGYTFTLNTSCFRSIFRSGHLKLPWALFKNETMVFVAVLGNACVKLREAAQDTSEEWLGKSGRWSRWKTSRRHDILSGHSSNSECVTNSPAWEAACLSPKRACEDSRRHLNPWPPRDEHKSATGTSH